MIKLKRKGLADSPQRCVTLLCSFSSGKNTNVKRELKSLNGKPNVSDLILNNKKHVLKRQTSKNGLQAVSRYVKYYNITLKHIKKI